MKRSEKQKIVRDQLSESLKPFGVLAKVDRPHTGWIKAIRSALGMSLATLAKRVGVHKSRVAKIEQDEVAGNLTVKTMQKIADGLDCVFVYGFVPRHSLDKVVYDQAFIKASHELSKIMHTMSLEAQDIPDKEQEKLLEQILNQILESGNVWK